MRRSTDARRRILVCGGSLLACLLLVAAAPHGGQVAPPAPPPQGPGVPSPVGGGILGGGTGVGTGVRQGPTGLSGNTGSGGPTTAGSGASRMGRPANGANTGTTSKGAGVRGSGRSAATTSGAATAGASRAIDAGSWEFWWYFNRERFLSLRSRLVDRSTISGSVGALTGRGRRSRTTATYRPDIASVDGQIVPVLLELLATNEEQDILDSSVLAAARSCRGATRDAVLEALVPHLGSRHLSVQSATALAFGAMDHDGVRAILRSLARDDSTGRDLAGGGPVPDLTRSFAALSLGMAGRASDALVLADLVRRLPDRERELKLCSIIALGLLGADDAVGTGVQATLLDLLRDKRLDPGIRCHVPTALARADDHGLVPELVDAFTDRDADRRVQQSVAIALGRLARLDDGRAVDALLDAVTDARDVHVRHFALVALGEIGARPSEGRGADLRLLRVLDALLRETDGKGGSRIDRSWGALGAALLARGRPETQPRVLDHLRAAYVAEADPAFKGAFAVALGLLEDRASALEVAADFDAVRDLGFRGHAAVALGLLGHEEAATELRDLCTDNATPSPLRVEAALGLGLLADRGAVPLLVRELRTDPPLSVTAGLARALGLIGDDGAVRPLVELAVDDSRTAGSRAFACVALGLLGARRTLPFQQEVLAHENFVSDSVVLAELRDIL